MIGQPSLNDFIHTCCAKDTPDDANDYADDHASTLNAGVNNYESDDDKPDNPNNEEEDANKGYTTDDNVKRLLTMKMTLLTPMQRWTPNMAHAHGKGSVHNTTQPTLICII
jgi:hypothetical protein